MPPRLRPFLDSKGAATGGIRIANANAYEDEDDATGAVCLEVGGAGTSGDSGKRREKSEVGGDVGAAGRAAAPVKGKRTTISIQLELFGRSGHYCWDLRTHSKGEEGLAENV